MFKTTTDFKIGQLNALEKQIFEIIEENQQLNFHIRGSNNNNSYSLSFTSIISLEEMLKFNLNEHIDFIQERNKISKATVDAVHNKAVDRDRPDIQTLDGLHHAGKGGLCLVDFFSVLTDALFVMGVQPCGSLGIYPLQHLP